MAGLAGFSGASGSTAGQNSGFLNMFPTSAPVQSTPFNLSSILPLLLGLGGLGGGMGGFNPFQQLQQQQSQQQPDYFGGGLAGFSGRRGFTDPRFMPFNPYLAGFPSMGGGGLPGIGAQPRIQPPPPPIQATAPQPTPQSPQQPSNAIPPDASGFTVGGANTPMGSGIPLNYSDPSVVAALTDWQGIPTPSY